MKDGDLMAGSEQPPRNLKTKQTRSPKDQSAHGLSLPLMIDPQKRRSVEQRTPTPESPASPK